MRQRGKRGQRGQLRRGTCLLCRRSVFAGAAVASYITATRKRGAGCGCTGSACRDQRHLDEGCWHYTPPELLAVSWPCRRAMAGAADADEDQRVSGSVLKRPGRCPGRHAGSTGRGFRLLASQWFSLTHSVTQSLSYCHFRPALPSWVPPAACGLVESSPHSPWLNQCGLVEWYLRTAGPTSGINRFDGSCKKGETGTSRAFVRLSYNGFRWESPQASRDGRELTAQVPKHGMNGRTCPEHRNVRRPPRTRG